MILWTRCHTGWVGAATSVWAATAPELLGRGGLYLEDCGIAETVTPAKRHAGFAPHIMDKNLAGRLWARSEACITGW